VVPQSKLFQAGLSCFPVPIPPSPSLSFFPPAVWPNKARCILHGRTFSRLDRRFSQPMCPLPAACRPPFRCFRCDRRSPFPTRLRNLYLDRRNHKNAVPTSRRLSFNAGGYPLVFFFSFAFAAPPPPPTPPPPPPPPHPPPPPPPPHW